MNGRTRQVPTREKLEGIGSIGTGRYTIDGCEYVFGFGIELGREVVEQIDLDPDPEPTRNASHKVQDP